MPALVLTPAPVSTQRRAWRSMNSRSAPTGSAFERSLQLRDVELDLALHLRGDAARLLPVAIRHHLHEHGRHDLPAHAELVANPAAGDFLAAVLRKRAPVAVHFRLVAAVHAERNGVGEVVTRTRAHREEWLTEQAELDAGDRRGAAGFGGQLPDAGDARLREELRIEAGGLFGLVHVPEVRNEPGRCGCGHGMSS